MRDNLIWAKVSYDIIDKNNKVFKETRNKACFSDDLNYRLSSHNAKGIKLYTLDCKLTIEYRDKYLQYVIDMFNLKTQNAYFNNQYFYFDFFECKYKNLLVLSVLRFLTEYMGARYDSNINISFFNNLFNGKCKYRNKLKRFSYFYKELKSHTQYWHIGHSWNPKETVIKSTQDFIKCKELKNTNSFFTT